MARIKTYTGDQTINPGDKVIGTDVVDGATKNYGIDELTEYFAQTITEAEEPNDITSAIFVKSGDIVTLTLNRTTGNPFVSNFQLSAGTGAILTGTEDPVVIELNGLPGDFYFQVDLTTDPIIFNAYGPLTQSTSIGGFEAWNDVGPTNLVGATGEMGDQGAMGDQGVGITTITGDNPILGEPTTVTVARTDPSGDTTPADQTFVVQAGVQGVIGPDGPQGEQGIGITSISGDVPVLGLPTTVTVTRVDPTGDTTPIDETFVVQAGVQGEMGDKGDLGDTGTAATIAVGVVTTGVPGTDATFTETVTSTAQERVYDVEIPRGDVGPAAIIPEDVIRDADFTPSAGNVTTINIGGVERPIGGITTIPEDVIRDADFEVNQGNVVAVDINGTSVAIGGSVLGGLIDQEDGTSLITWDSEATLEFVQGADAITDRIYEVDIPDSALNTVPIAEGGTGADNATDARTNLGIVDGGGGLDQSEVDARIADWAETDNTDPIPASKYTDTTYDDTDFELPISLTNQVAYDTEISGLPTLGTLSGQDDLTADQITALSIPLPVSDTNQVDYATDIENVPTEFAPSAHMHVLADVTDSGALAALNNVDYSGTIITNKPFTHATQAAFESAVDTRITTIGDVVIFADAAAFTADSASTTWHRGDVAILTDTNVAYLFTGTDGDTTVTLVADFHQITSTETLISLGITASAAELNQLMGITLGALAAQDNLTAEQIAALNIPAASSIVLNEDPNTISDGTTTLRALPDAIVEEEIFIPVATPTVISSEAIGSDFLSLNLSQGVLVDDTFDHLGTTYTITLVISNFVQISPALVDAVPANTVLSIERDTLSFYIRDRDISIVNAANSGITIEPTDIVQTLVGTATVARIITAAPVTQGATTLTAIALGLTAVGDNFSHNNIDNQTITEIDTATNTITFTPGGNFGFIQNQRIFVTRASNVITFLNGTDIELTNGGTALYLNSETRIPLADGHGPIGAINGGVYDAATDVLEIIPESVQNFRDATQHVRKWFGTQSQFDAITEITDGTVVYNIYPNA